MANIDPYLDIIRNGSDGDNVRDAIINCMNEINKDSDFKILSKVIQCKLSELNKRYEAKSGQVWKDVTIEVTDDSGNPIDTGDITVDDFTVNNETVNGKYTAEQGHQWGDIIVDIDWNSTMDDIEDNIVITMGNLDETGTFSASTIGKNGFRSITFSDAAAASGGTVGPGGVVTFDINFLDDDGVTKIGSKKIALNNPIDYMPHPTKAGKVFDKWEGDTKAVRNTSVTAHYSEPIRDLQEITDEWDVIVTKSGSYPIGSFKSLEISLTNLDYLTDHRIFPDQVDMPTEGMYEYAMSCYMIKVANGEGGSASSWISTYPTFNYYGKLVPPHITNYEQYDSDGYHKQYDKCSALIWLNSDDRFLKLLPMPLKNALMSVPKYFKYQNTGTGQLSNRPYNSKIWIPSIKELYIPGFDDDPNEVPDVCIDKTKYVDNAIGEFYMSEWLGFTRGIPRHDLLMRDTEFAPGNNNFSRDTGSDETWKSSRIRTLSPFGEVGERSSYFNTDSSGTISVLEPNQFGFCLAT